MSSACLQQTSLSTQVSLSQESWLLTSCLFASLIILPSAARTWHTLSASQMLVLVTMMTSWEPERLSPPKNLHWVCIQLFTWRWVALNNNHIMLVLSNVTERKSFSFLDICHVLCGFQWRSPDWPPPQSLPRQSGYANRHQQSGGVQKPLEWCHCRTSHWGSYCCLSGQLLFIICINLMTIIVCSVFFIIIDRPT